MKEIVCFVWSNKYNIHDLVTEEIVDLAKEENLNITLKNDSNEEVVRYLQSNECLNNSNLCLNWGAHISRAVKILNGLPNEIAKKLYAKSHFILEDNPYAEWLYEDVKYLSNSIVTSFEDVEKPIRLMELKLKKKFKEFRAENVLVRKPMLSDEALSHEKYFDVLIAMDFRKDIYEVESIISLLESTFSCKHPLDQSVYNDIFEECMNNPSLSTFEIFSNLIENKGFSLNVVAQEDPTLLDFFMYALHIIDINVRKTRRFNYIVKFFKMYPNLKVLLCDPHDALNLKGRTNNLTKISSINYVTYHGLLSRSRYTLFSNPTYPNLVNQRIVDGINNGCLSICDYVPALDEFYEKPDHAILSLESLEEDLRRPHETPIKLVNTYLKLEKRLTLAQSFMKGIQRWQKS